MIPRPTPEARRAAGARRGLATTAAALGGVLLAAVACSKPAPPTLAPVSASVAGITPDGIQLSLALAATNPNGSDLSGQGFTAHVLLNRSVDLGTATLAQPFSLPAGKTTPLAVPVEVKWSNVAALFALAQTTGDIPYTVDGTATMGGSLLNVAVPFHLEGALTHAQLVEAAGRSIPGLGSLPGLPSFTK